MFSAVIAAPGRQLVGLAGRGCLGSRMKPVLELRCQSLLMNDEA